MILRSAWVYSRDRLAQASIPDASLESEVILRKVSGLNRIEFFTSLEVQLSGYQIKTLDDYIVRRLSGEPLSYLIGIREFYGLDFVVTPSVLIPRQETEHLVEAVITFSRSLKDSRLVIADVGTGSGAIAIAIAVNLNDAIVHATDISQRALVVAKKNREIHDLTNRVFLHQGDLLDSLPENIDIIVSNPPYIPTTQMAELPLEVRYEPTIALDGGDNGIEVLNRLINNASHHLNASGKLIVEIAPTQLDAVTRIANHTFVNSNIRFQRDLAGKPRVIIVDLAH